MADKQSATILPFQRASISKDDGGNTGNWLRDMLPGTRFLAKRISDNSSELIDFVVGSDPKAMLPVFLGESINTPEGRFRFRDPKIFVRDYTLFTILEVLETKDGNDNPRDAAPVERISRPKKRTKVHEGEQRIPPGDEPGKV